MMQKALEKAREERKKQLAKEFIKYEKKESRKSKRKDSREYRKNQTKFIGDRLEDTVERVLKRLKGKGIIQNYKSMPNNENVPDFVVNEDIAIECKNWNPERKSGINKHTLEDKILPRFSKDWNRKILVIPKLEFYETHSEDCKKKIEEEGIEVVEGFPWVSNYRKARNDALRKISAQLKHLLEQ